MPITINDTEYLTTRESMALLDIRGYKTWTKLAQKHGIGHYTQIGKGRRKMWKKNDVEPLVNHIEMH